MISVYRIHLGRCWNTSGRDRALIELLDGLADFFYRVSAVEDEIANNCVGLAERRSATRIAMTQAHVLLLPTDANEICATWPGVELETALKGLRQRIPVVAIAGPGASVTDTVITRAADLSVGWNANDIGCAILQTAEAEASERRKRMAQLDAIADVMLGGGEMPQRDRVGRRAQRGTRELPIGEISKAYADLRAHK